MSGFVYTPGIESIISGGGLEESNRPTATEKVRPPPPRWLKISHPTPLPIHPSERNRLNSHPPGPHVWELWRGTVKGICGRCEPLTSFGLFWGIHIMDEWQLRCQLRKTMWVDVDICMWRVNDDMEEDRVVVVVVVVLISVVVRHCRRVEWFRDWMAVVDSTTCRMDECVGGGEVWGGRVFWDVGRGLWKWLGVGMGEDFLMILGWPECGNLVDGRFAPLIC